jgi:hypothetical protein
VGGAGDGQQFRQALHDGEDDDFEHRHAPQLNGDTLWDCERGLAVRAKAPLARVVGFASFGRSRLDLWMNMAGLRAFVLKIL